MCKIDFKIEYTDAEGNSLQAAEGRYKLKTATSFKPIFAINLTNPQTPDITVDGEYDLEVRVQDSSGLWSNWYTSPEGFKIGNCTPTQGENTFFSVIKLSSSRFKFETSRFINSASFTLRFMVKHEENAQGDSVAGSTTDYFNTVITLNNFDLQNTSDQGTIISEIISNPEVIDNVASWNFLGNIYSIEFNTIYGTVGEETFSLVGITNVIAT